MKNTTFRVGKLVIFASVLVIFGTTRFCNGDEFLDAVVDFIHPPGSHFSEKSEANILGAPDTTNVNVDVPESLIVAFIDNFVFDGPGNDLLIVERIGGDSIVNIYGSADGVLYEFLVQTDTDSNIDLADYSLETLRYLRVDGLGNGGTTPGYEFDGARALNSMDVKFARPTSYHLNAFTNFERFEDAHDDGNSIGSVFGRPDSVSVSIDLGEFLDVAFADIQVVDGPGIDLYIYEHFNLDSSVRIFGSEDGVLYELLGETDRSFSVDLADYSLDSVRFLRFEGLDDGGEIPGYELDGAVAINFECVEIIPGDANLDGEVDLLDVSKFVFYVSNGLYLPQADVNQDGSSDLLDIAGFVQLIGN